MIDDNKLTLLPNGDDADFYRQVADLLAASRKYAKKQMDNTIAITYFEVGRMIVEREQRGQKRAQYGARLIKGLSAHLTVQLGKGFSVPTIKNIRQFYLVYSTTIKGYSPISVSVSADDDEKSYSMISLFESAQKQQALSAKFVEIEKGQSLSDLFKLSWTHYQILMRVRDDAARRFYEIEAASQQWSVRQLQRQVGKLALRAAGTITRKRRDNETGKRRAFTRKPARHFQNPLYI